jgi:hypothetical protein
MSISIGSNSNGDVELYTGSIKVLTADAKTGIANFENGANFKNTVNFINGANFDTANFKNGATAPTTAAGTNNNQVATTAFAYGTLSANGNGYQILPSGLIIQWGVITGYQYEGSLTATFPIAFPNNIFTAYASTQNTNGNANAMMQVIGPSLTGMSVLFNYFAGTNGDGYASAHWLAIGN